jgi:hypothetical protein
MAKRATGRAWGLSGALAGVLVVGVGVLLAHGIRLGHTEVRVFALDRWEVGTVEIHTCIGRTPLQMIRLGFFAIVVDRSPWL